MGESELELYEIVNNPTSITKYSKFDIYVSTGTTTKLISKRKLYLIGPHDRLYIRRSNRIKLVQDQQQKLNIELLKSLKVDIKKSRKILTDLVSVTMSEPRSQVLAKMKDTINIIVEEYLKNPEVVTKLTHVSVHDYSTSLHLANCMLFCMGYATYAGYSKSDMKELGFVGLMHDVGKLEIPDYLLQAPRKLTDEEFDIVKKHTIVGYDVLASFGEKVQNGACDHHERLDGSGYPHGKLEKELSKESKIISIIDVFDALTHWRPYKDAFDTLPALQLIRDDVVNKKFDREIFETFARSLASN